MIQVPELGLTTSSRVLSCLAVFFHADPAYSTIEEGLMPQVVEAVDKLYNVLAMHAFTVEAMATIATSGVTPEVAQGFRLVSANIENNIEEAIDCFNFDYAIFLEFLFIFKVSVLDGIKSNPFTCSKVNTGHTDGFSILLAWVWVSFDSDEDFLSCPLHQMCVMIRPLPSISFIFLATTIR